MVCCIVIPCHQRQCSVKYVVILRVEVTPGMAGSSGTNSQLLRTERLARARGVQGRHCCDLVRGDLSEGGRALSRNQPGDRAVNNYATQLGCSAIAHLRACTHSRTARV